MSEEPIATTAQPQQAGETQPQGQTFNLKPTETNTLIIVRTNQQGEFAAILNMIAVERFGYNTTARTQFVLNAEMTSITISELPEDVPVAKDNTPEEPKSGAVAAK